MVGVREKSKAVRTVSTHFEWSGFATAVVMVARTE
jgi:hypothetical protein